METINENENNDSDCENENGDKRFPFRIESDFCIGHFIKMFETREYPDISLLVGGKTIQTHKVIISQIPFFKKMIDLKMKESIENKYEIKDVDPEILEKILGFCYGKTIVCSGEDEFLEIIRVADYFGIERIKEIVHDYFPVQQDTIFFILENRNIFKKDFFRTCFGKMTTDKLGEWFLTNERFFSLDYEIIQELCNYYHIESEEKLFCAVCEWILENNQLIGQKRKILEQNNNNNNDSKEFYDIFQHFYFNDIDSKIIEKYSHLLNQNILCKLPMKEILSKKNDEFKNTSFKDLISLPLPLVIWKIKKLETETKFEKSFVLNNINIKFELEQSRLMTIFKNFGFKKNIKLSIIVFDHDKEKIIDDMYTSNMITYQDSIFFYSFRLKNAKNFSFLFFLEKRPC